MFSVASTYKALHEKVRGTIEDEVMVEVWKLQVSSKIRIMICRLCLNRIPTVDNLKIKNCGSEAIGELCLFL